MGRRCRPGYLLWDPWAATGLAVWPRFPACCWNRAIVLSLLLLAPLRLPSAPHFNFT